MEETKVVGRGKKAVERNEYEMDMEVILGKLQERKENVDMWIVQAGE